MRHLRGSLPAYLQIVEFLVREISAGRLGDGEKLPPERDMATNFGIAVGTLRKALAELETRGLLRRIQGSGNYIRAISDPHSIYSMFRLELIGGGGLPTADVLDVERLDKPSFLPPFGRSDQAHRIRRLRRLSGQAAALEEIWLDGSFIETISRQDLSDSLYLFYNTRLRLRIIKAEDQIGQGQVPDWSPASFGLKPGESACLVSRNSYMTEQRIAEISFSWFDHNVARYVSRLK